MNKESFVIGREDAYGDWGADYLMECLTALEKTLAERKRLSGGGRRYRDSQ